MGAVVKTEKLKRGQLLTLDETVERLKLSRATVYRLVGAGQLPVVRIAMSGKKKGVLRFRERDIEQFVNDRLELVDDSTRDTDRLAREFGVLPRSEVKRR